MVGPPMNEARVGKHILVVEKSLHEIVFLQREILALLVEFTTFIASEIMRQRTNYEDSSTRH